MFGGIYFAQGWFASSPIFAPRNFRLVFEPKPGSVTDRLHHPPTGKVTNILATLTGKTTSKLASPSNGYTRDGDP